MLNVECLDRYPYIFFFMTSTFNFCWFCCARPWSLHCFFSTSHLYAINSISNPATKYLNKIEFSLKISLHRTAQTNQTHKHTHVQIQRTKCNHLVVGSTKATSGFFYCSSAKDLKVKTRKKKTRKKERNNTSRLKLY